MPRGQLTARGADVRRDVTRAKGCDGIVPFPRIEMPLLMLPSKSETETRAELTYASHRKTAQVLRKDFAKTGSADLRVGAAEPVAVEHIKHLEIQAELIALAEP